MRATMSVSRFRHLKVFEDRHFRDALSATWVSLVLKLGSAGAIFMLGLVVARRFGAEGSGVFGVASTIMAIAVIGGLCGLDYSATRAISQYEAEERWPAMRAWVRSAGLLMLGASGLFALITVAAAGPLSNLFGGGDAMTDAVIALGLASLPVAATRLLSALLRGSRRFVEASLVDPFLVPAGTLLLVLIVPVGSVAALTVLYALVAAVVASGGLFLWRRTANARGERAVDLGARRVLKSSLPIYGTLLGAFATPWVTLLMLSAYATEAETGVYRVATQFGVLLSFILQAVENGMSPQFAALQATGDLHSVAVAARRMIVILLLVGGIPAVLIGVFADPVLGIFGPEFTSGATALRMLAGAQILLFVMGPVGSVLIMTGLGRLSFWNSMAGALLVLALSLLLIPPYGVNGAAAAAAIAFVARAVAATAIVWSRRGIFMPLGITRGPA
jgi:O-antigen/teichoic acid export membrane protein